MEMVTDDITKNEKSTSDDEFSKLCEDTYADLQKYALWLTRGDKYTAEEIVQNTYELAKKKQDIVLAHPNPAGWLSKTAQNYNMKHITKIRKIQAYETELVYDVPYKIETYKELFDEIYHRLSEQEQRFFVDHYEYDISLVEMAERDNISYDKLKKFNVKLKSKIAKMLTVT